MITIAVDGPAGTGKSSTSKALANHFGFAYLDTGAMYRAAAWQCIKQGIELNERTAKENAQEITECVSRLFTHDNIVFSTDPGNQYIKCADEDITEEIRSEEISSHVSAVASVIPVRHVLIAAQKAFIAQENDENSFSKGAGIVIEGRDITTVVAPDADVRILMTAKPEIRQARRENQAKNEHAGHDDVSARDNADSKVTNFLTAADGVITIDNSYMNFEQTLETIVGIVDKAIDEKLYSEFVSQYESRDENDEDEISDIANFADGSSFSRGSQDRAVGVLAVIGRPNVGKSTLVNRILGRRAAVVEDTPGVTRDRVSYDAHWAGTDFKLVDTGGWEADVEGIDSSIASQAEIAANLSDAIIFTVDGTTGLTSSDERIVSMLRACNKPVTVAVNKVDTQLDEYAAAEFWKLGLGEPMPISALHGRGIGDLLDTAINKLKNAEKTSGFLTPTDLRRIALVGRPNVGKSSLLNKLANEERAVVHDLAGTTRDPVDEIVNIGGKDWLFIDTAGIKRRLHKVSGADYYSSLRTQAALERSELALVVFDVSEPIAEQDLRVMSQAVDAGRAIVLVFNKWDLLDEFSRARLERLWKTEFTRVTWAQRINLSAKTGWHTNRLMQAMENALESWDKRIPTGKLNSFLGRIQAAHPHPLRGGKQPRILFATQASNRPPRFMIFATGFLEHGYCRFIERSLREEFGFEGSPVQISVKIREKKRK